MTFTNDFIRITATLDDNIFNMSNFTGWSHNGRLNDCHTRVWENLYIIYEIDCWKVDEESGEETRELLQAISKLGKTGK